MERSSGRRLSGGEYEAKEAVNLEEIVNWWQPIGEYPRLKTVDESEEHL